MRNFWRRVLVARAATVIMTACGIAAGYLLGCVLAVLLAENWLNQYSKLIEVQGDASFVEARNLLDVMKHSRYPFCSDAEIAYFRELVFRSIYLKDAGRIHAGKIDCSATAGRPMWPIGQFKPNSPEQDGTIAYNNLVPIRGDSLKRTGLQKGNAFVVFGSYLPASLGPVPMRLITNMDESASKQSGLPAGYPQKGNVPNLTTDGTVRMGHVLYSTRCSILHSSCVTASTSVTEALHGESSAIAGCTAVGGLFGFLLGMAFSSVYHRSKDTCQQLRRAVARNKLQVVYQPIVSLVNERIVGAETLARWTDEEGNEVSPDVFIRIAEDHGFVGEITKLVVRRALRDFAETLRQHPDFRLSVNVTAMDLSDPEFLPMLDGSLKQAKVQPKSLAIEITESSTASREEPMETIRNLRSRGHSIHIDDFGTGYSNLSYLLYISVDTIKIDKAFTQVIGTEAVSVAILPQILAMAKSLGLEVIVEGIETAQQQNYFFQPTQHMYGQGWLFGHPVPAEEFHILLAENWAKLSVPANSAAAKHKEEHLEYWPPQHH
jgi:sensor c-di-GMP phosphodiesterase-like protein